MLAKLHVTVPSQWASNIPSASGTETADGARVLGGSSPVGFHLCLGASPTPGGPLCLIGAHDPSPLLSLPARLDPPIDGRSPKFWGEAICNLAIQRPGAKQARDPGPVFSSFSQHPHIPGIHSCRLTIFCNSRQPAATTGTFFCSCLQVTGSGRGCCQSGNFFSLPPPLLSNPQPSPSLRWASHCSPQPGPRSQNSTGPVRNHQLSKPRHVSATLHHPLEYPSLGFASRSSRLLLGCSVFSSSCTTFCRCFCCPGGFCLRPSPRRTSHVRPSPRHSSVPPPLRATKLAPVASDLGLYATTSPPFTSFRLLRQTTPAYFLCIRPTFLRPHARARSTPIGSSFAACPTRIG